MTTAIASEVMRKKRHYTHRKRIALGGAARADDRKRSLTIGECRHCSRTLTLYSRRLCMSCYHNPVIREKYPILKGVNLTRFAHSKDDNKEGVLPTAATGARPGSPEKIDVLAARIDRGERPWHPDDAEFDLE